MNPVASKVEEFLNRLEKMEKKSQAVQDSGKT